MNLEEKISLLNRNVKKFERRKIIVNGASALIGIVGSAVATVAIYSAMQHYQTISALKEILHNIDLPKAAISFLLGPVAGAFAYAFSSTIGDYNSEIRNAKYELGEALEGKATLLRGIERDKASGVTKNMLSLSGTYSALGKERIAEALRKHKETLCPESKSQISELRKYFSDKKLSKEKLEPALANLKTVQSIRRELKEKHAQYAKAVESRTRRIQSEESLDEEKVRQETQGYLFELRNILERQLEYEPRAERELAVLNSGLLKISSSSALRTVTKGEYNLLSGVYRSMKNGGIAHVRA
ncbi:MAG: hypothetical protein WCK90_01650 [archaeon]